MSETEGETPAAEGTHAAAAPVNAVCIATHGTLSLFDPMSMLSADYPAQSQVLAATVPPPPPDVEHLINHLSTTCICAANIKEWTSKDPILSRVQRFFLSGWPEKPPDKQFMSYFNKKKYRMDAFYGALE